MTGGSNISMPGPSPTEEALQSEQVGLLRQQRDILSQQMREQQLLAPILYGAAGVKPIVDPQTGQVTGFEEVQDPLKGRQDEVASRLLDRQLAALKGELPDNPALLKDLATQESTLKETMRKNLGPGWETSTAGGNQLTNFNTFRTNTLEAGRRGDLSLAEQLGIARENANQGTLNNYLGRLAGINANPLATASGFSQAAAGYNAPLANLMTARQGRLQANIARDQSNQAETAMWLNFASDTIGAVAGGAAAAMSSKRLKKDIHHVGSDAYDEALTKLRDTPIARWLYKWEPDDREPHIGPILELSPKEIHYGDGTHISLLDYSGLLHAGLKGLERKVDREFKSLREMVEAKGEA